MQFNELNLMEPLLRAVSDQGYTEPTPIQEQAIPPLLAGRDVIGLAQTGTGKTAAFALPVLQHLMHNNTSPKKGVQVLVMAPTRELASQIEQSFKDYGRYTHIGQMTIFGGVSQKPQVKKLRRGVHIVVATPGRLLDLMNQGHLNFKPLTMLVLDEADRMLDMGFLPDIKRILRKLPNKRQNLLFSATMSKSIHKLSREMLHNPVKVAIEGESKAVETVAQQVFFVGKQNKRRLLQHLLTERNMQRTLVFMRTKRGANRLSKKLNKARISAAPIHGDRSQSARERALDKFKRGKIKVLVATDIVARGIDVDDISHVVNYDLPNQIESYVHRIGRTGRAGASGTALSFCASHERKYLKRIQRLIDMQIPVSNDHPYPAGR
jgi:ATP-dependent RNA helicase RhlE